jgi:hypothetical protein
VTARAPAAIGVGEQKPAAEGAAEYLAPRELAALFKQKVSTLAKKRWDGSGVPFIVLGARILYKRSDAIAYLEARRVTSTADSQQRGLTKPPANKGKPRAAERLEKPILAEMKKAGTGE